MLRGARQRGLAAARAASVTVAVAPAAAGLRMLLSMDASPWSVAASMLGAAPANLPGAG
jgi:hypothetical protein